MPGEDIYSWSTTAIANIDADTAIDWREGMARKAVNDSARGMMAAHAKNRNLLNGSIVTGGSANAQIFTSGIGYTTVPTGIRVLLKVGFTNTGAATLSMDAIAGSPIKNMAGGPLLGGELVAGQFVDFLYDGTSWILLRRGATTGGGLSGRFVVNNASLVAFNPYNGNGLKIAGTLFEIPAVGLQAVINNCTSDGVPGSTLIVGNTYNVYVFNHVTNGLTLDFSTTAHVIDTAVANVGTEIKSGDASRSLVGKVTIFAGPTFGDSETFRGCLSWFNRRQRVAKTSYTGSTSSPVLVDAGIEAYFLSWGDEDAFFALAGNTSNTNVNVTNYTNLFIDNVSYILPDTTWETIALPAPAYANIAGIYHVRVTEGRHFVRHRVATNGGTGYWIVNAEVVFSG